MKIRALACALVLVGALPGPTIAQNTAPSGLPPEQPVGARPASTVSSGSASASATAPTDTGISDIIVTATRREERLQRIPVTVTAMSALGLSNAGITDARSLTQAVPSLNFGRSGFIALPSIRGVGSNGISNGDEANVAIYVDGVYQADSFTAFTEFVQVDRVEVLRGPQGTVFGRNATGGLINTITPDPKFDFKGTVSGSVGRTRENAGVYNLRGYLTGPLKETLAADLAVMVRRNDSYITDLLHGGAEGKENVVDVRSKLLFEPSGKARMILTGEYIRQRSNAVIYEALQNIQASAYPGYIARTGPWQTSDDFLPRYDYDKYSTSLRTTFDLGAVAFETTGSYQHSHVHYTQDQDVSNLVIATANPLATTEALSQEIRLLSSGNGRFTWLIGGYAFHLTSDGVLTFGNAPNDAAGRPIPGTLNYLPVSPKVGTTSLASFAEGTLQVTEPLYVTVGARYTTEKRTFEQGLIVGGVRRVTIPELKKKFDKATYKIAIRYQITPSTNLYGSYGTGFKSGVFNVTTLAITPSNSGSVNPEGIKSAEIGIKSDITHGVRLNISAYHYLYNNLQVSTRAPDGTFPLQNAAQAKIYGGEVELTVLPVPDLTLSGSVAYTHARYSDFPQAQCYRPALPNEASFPGNTTLACDAKGNTLFRAPDWTFNFAPQYRISVGSGEVMLGGNVFHSSRVFYDFANFYSQKPYTLVNGQALYRTPGNLEFSLKVQNMLNQAVAQQIRVSNRSVDALLERPRTVILGIKYDF